MSLTKVTKNLITAGALTSKTANYTVLDEDSFINVDATSGDLTMTMPAASTREGISFTFRKSDTTVNVIDLGGVIDLTNPAQVMTLMSDGTNWIVTNVSTPNRYTVLAATVTPTGTLAAAYNNVVWATVEGDTYGLYNTSTGVWSAPKDGIINVAAFTSFSFTAAGGKSGIIRIANTTTSKNITGQDFNTASQSLTFPTAAGALAVSAGDTVAVQSYCDGASAAFQGGQHSFSISYQGE